MVIPILLVTLYIIASIGLLTIGMAQKYSDLSEIARKTSIAAYLVKEQDDAMITLPGFETYRVSFFKANLQKTVFYQVSAKPFTGISLKDIKEVGGEDTDSLVFVTENATVFHKNRNCTHLKLSIEQTLLANVHGLRNIGGGKYKPCEKCGKNGFNEIVLITKEGDRYHSDISCSGLKRTVRSITEKEAEEMGLGPCSRCGG